MIYLSAFADEASASLDGQIKALLKHNIKYSEIRSVNGVNVSKFDIKTAKEYQKQMEDNGIKVWSIGSPIGKVDINVDFNEYLNLFKHVLDLANVFETDKIRMFSFFNAYNQKSKVFDYLNQMVEIAKSYNVTLCHENEKEVYGDTAERVLELVNNCKGLKFIYDPVNYIACGEDAKKTLELFFDQTEYFHIKDMIADSGEHVPAGLGDGKISDIDNFEMKNKFKFNSNEEAFDAAVKSLKEILIKSNYKETNGGFIKQ